MRQPVHIAFVIGPELERLRELEDGRRRMDAARGCGCWLVMATLLWLLFALMLWLVRQ